MANSKFERNRSEMELILGAGELFHRSDQKMTILYRLHNLPHRRIEDDVGKFRDQDFVLNLTIGDRYILAQEEKEDHRFGESCYFGELGPTVDTQEEVDNADNDDVLPQDTPFRTLDDEDSQNFINKKQRLFGDCYSKYLDPKGHCQVGRDKWGLLIKDLGSKHGTFVNGTKLDVGVCHALKSGDLISLGFVYEEDKPWMLEIGHYWVFKVSEVSKFELELAHRKAVTREAMSNSEVVDTIFSNLGFKELKAFRSVSKVWDEAAKRELRSRATVVFEFYDPKLDILNPNGGSVAWDEDWNERAQKKLLTLQKIRTRNVSFKDNFGLTWAGLNLGLILDLDFPTERLVFLQNILTNNHITSVNLDFMAKSDNSTSLFKSILSCPQLRQVTFDSRLFLVFYEGEELGTNESVQKLIFTKPLLSPKMLQLFPNAREIELQSTIVAELFLRKKYEDELEGVKVLKISNKKNESETFFICNECGAVHSYDETLSCRGDKLTICKLSPLICALPDSLQLTRLEITDLHDLTTSNDGNFMELFNLLSKFKNSLQFLKLGLILNGNLWKPHQKFPEMKMLTVFKLDFQNAALPLLLSGFGSEIFPQLKILEVAIASEKLAEKFVKNNFGCVSDFKNLLNYYIVLALALALALDEKA